MVAIRQEHDRKILLTLVCWDILIVEAMVLM